MKPAYLVGVVERDGVQRYVAYSEDNGRRYLTDGDDAYRYKTIQSARRGAVTFMRNRNALYYATQVYDANDAERGDLS